IPTGTLITNVANGGNSSIPEDMINHWGATVSSGVIFLATARRRGQPICCVCRGVFRYDRAENLSGCSSKSSWKTSTLVDRLRKIHLWRHGEVYGVSSWLLRSRHSQGLPMVGARPTGSHIARSVRSVREETPNGIDLRRPNPRRARAQS